VAIIALLIAILLPSLNKARENAKKAACAANVKAQVAMCSIYAAGWGDRMPACAGGGTPIWMWDEGSRLYMEALVYAKGGQGDNMAATNGLRRMFYDPSNPDQNVDSMWLLAGQTVLGYAWMNDRSSNPGGWNPDCGGDLKNAVFATINTGSRFPKLEYERNFNSVTNPTERELVFCPIINRDQNFFTTDWTVQGVILHHTNHMSGLKPAGQNVGCFDGHVEWRVFPSVQAKTDSWRTAGNPYWYLVRP